MNNLQVTKECTVSAAGFADKSFAIGDTVAVSSPYYYPLLWSGNTLDTGVEDSSLTVDIFQANEIVVSEENPYLAPGGVWIQPIGDSDWTMWIEE